MEDELAVEMVGIEDLRPHPRNYRAHPDDQLEHITASIQKYGLYRNVVVARDGTILAGHGVVAALRRIGVQRVPVVRLPVDADSPQALAVLTGDNEVRHLAEIDDRLLSELLKEVKDKNPGGLRGTGYDDAMLAALVMVTRTGDEISGFNEAAEWVGMPEYDPQEDVLKVTVSFRSVEDRNAFFTKLGLTAVSVKSKSMWWPPVEGRQNLSAMQFRTG